MSYGTSFQQQIYYRSPYMIKNFISSYYGWLQKRERYSSSYHYHLESLSKSQWLPNNELHKLQFYKVKNFLKHSYEHSRYYRYMFKKHRFDPKNMHSLRDITSLPIQRKVEVRDHLAEIIPDNVKEYQIRWCHTSGTTGTALQFPVSSECFQREYAFRSLHYLWGNIQYGDKLAHCSGHPVTSHARQRPPYWVYDYANNWLLLSSYHLSEANLRHYIAELEKFQPSFMVGYPSTIYLLALANENCGGNVHLKAIFTTSETLFEFQRHKIEESFGCKVFMWYGNTEMCGNIVECEQGKYHLKLEHSYVEILDDNDHPVSSGQSGRMVCTGFGNYAFPLIRYSIDDSAVTANDNSCPCGRGGEIIQEVVGRTEDYILTPEGRMIGRLDHIFKDATHVKLAQIIQNNAYEVIIRIVNDKMYSPKDESEIINEARIRLGPSIKITFDYVADIPRSGNGKYRFIISNITRDKIMQGLSNAIL
jgi:phenylacetate-CoA ligase